VIRFLNNLQELSKNQINWKGENEDVEVIELKNNKFQKGVLLLRKYLTGMICISRKGK
jgi:hypothetical protein